jgi:hypothetical protein
MSGGDGDGDDRAGWETRLEDALDGVDLNPGSYVSRRRALQSLGVGVLGAAGVGSLRLGDYRPYDPEVPGWGDRPPRERVAAAGRALHAVPHRAVTRVRVTDDGTDEAPYPFARHRVVRDHARRRHLLVATTLGLPPLGRGPVLPGLFFGFARQRAVDAVRDPDRGGLPFTGVTYATDGSTAFAYGVPTPNSVDARPRIDGGRHTPRSSTDDEGFLSQEYVLSHRASWETVAETDAAATYRIDDLDAYAQVPPLPPLGGTQRLHEGCRIEASLDKETGLLTRLVDRRDVTREEVFPPEDREGDPARTRRLRFRIETTFDRYGEASVPTPAGLERLELGAFVEAVLGDLTTY